MLRSAQITDELRGAIASRFHQHDLHAWRPDIATPLCCFGPLNFGPVMKDDVQRLCWVRYNKTQRLANLELGHKQNYPLSKFGDLDIDNVHPNLSLAWYAQLGDVEQPDNGGADGDSQDGYETPGERTPEKAAPPRYGVCVRTRACLWPR